MKYDWVNEAGSNMWIRVEKIVAKVDEEHLVVLGATYVAP
jgi:hypothetical protein